MVTEVGKHKIYQQMEKKKVTKFEFGAQEKDTYTNDKSIFKHLNFPLSQSPIQCAFSRNMPRMVPS